MPLPKSLSVGARQKFGSGPEAMSSRPRNRNEASVPVSRSKRSRKSGPETTIVRGPSSTVRAAGEAGVISRAGAAAACHGRANCSAATAWPLGRPGDASLVTTDRFRKYSVPGLGGTLGRGRTNVRLSRGPTRGRSTAPEATVRPSAATSQRRSKRSRPMKS